MRFSVCIPCFFPKTDFADAIRRVGALGYDAAEGWGWNGVNMDAVKAACEETGVQLVSMCTSCFRMTELDRRGEWLDGLIKSCSAARKLGVHKLITQVGPDTGAPREEQHASISEGLRRAIPILEESGVTLMIEPLNTLYDHRGYYLVSSSEAFDLVREAGHPQIKMVFDIYHQQVSEGNVTNNIVRNLDCIAHLHAAGNPGRHELQKGENDYSFIFDAVGKAGYKGLCGLEYFPTMDAEESLVETRRIYGV